MSRSKNVVQIPPKIDEYSLLLNHAVEATANSHNAVKSSWLVLFSGGAVIVLSAFHSELKCFAPIIGANTTADSMCRNQPSSFDLTTTTLASFIYVLTFIRFYIGDIRLFDIRYSEIFKLAKDYYEKCSKVGSVNEKFSRDLCTEIFTAYSDRNLYKIENIFLIFQTLFIVFIALYTREAVNFLFLFTVLLFVNAAWLWFIALSGKTLIADKLYRVFPFLRDVPTISASLPQTASKFWAINNTIFSVLIISILIYIVTQYYNSDTNSGSLSNYQATYEALIIIAFLLALANSIIDLIFTWSFYFPQFGSAFASLASEQNLTQPHDFGVGTKVTKEVQDGPAAAPPPEHRLWFR